MYKYIIYNILYDLLASANDSQTLRIMYYLTLYSIL